MNHWTEEDYASMLMSVGAQLPEHARARREIQNVESAIVRLANHVKIYSTQRRCFMIKTDPTMLVYDATEQPWTIGYGGQPEDNFGVITSPHRDRAIDVPPGGWNKPSIEGGSLRIPFDCHPRYRWWTEDGQSITETLAELDAPWEVAVRYIPNTTKDEWREIVL